MSKKKKRKTRKQKQRAQIHKKEYLRSIKPESKPSLPREKDTKEKNALPLKLSDAKATSENEFTIFNIKKSIAYTLFFLLIIVILYTLELNFHYFSDLSNSLISILIR